MLVRSIILALSTALAVPSLGEVVTCELSADPLAEGWTVVAQWGEVTTWVENSIYYQEFPNNCQPGPVCGNQSLSRSIETYNGRDRWFYEYRASATGTSSEIPNGAPTVLSTANNAGNVYHATLSSNQIKLKGDADLPIVFYDVQPGIPHTIRLELFNDPPPATFHWYVDSVLVLEGLGDSPFPDFDSRITWQGRSWMQPTLNSWWYIRFGDIPVDGSGDFDSNGAVDSFDHFYFSECLDRSAVGEPAQPSCSWADMDASGLVDCTDWDSFRAAWTGADPLVTPSACAQPVPAVSMWGVTMMSLLTFTAAALVFRVHPPRLLCPR